MSSFLHLQINHTHSKLLTNHTIAVRHHMRKKFCLEVVSRTSCKNSKSRAATKTLCSFCVENIIFRHLEDKLSTFLHSAVFTLSTLLVLFSQLLLPLLLFFLVQKLTRTNHVFFLTTQTPACRLKWLPSLFWFCWRFLPRVIPFRNHQRAAQNGSL